MSDCSESLVGCSLIMSEALRKRLKKHLPLDYYAESFRIVGFNVDMVCDPPLRLPKRSGGFRIIDRFCHFVVEAPSGDTRCISEDMVRSWIKHGLYNCRKEHEEFYPSEFNIDFLVGVNENA